MPEHNSAPRKTWSKKDWRPPTLSETYASALAPIIAMMEKGVAPWRKTWSPMNPPRNAVSGKVYQGFNFLLLNALAAERKSNTWLTFKQSRDLGGCVKKGEKSTHIVHWNFPDRDKAAGVKAVAEPDHIEEAAQTLALTGKRAGGRPYLSLWSVFNLDQTEGVDLKKMKFNPYPAAVVHVPGEGENRAAAIFAAAPICPIRHGGGRPCYSPAKDEIILPLPDNFENLPAYYATLAHECMHATGHPDRLGRFKSDSAVKNGSREYALEEMVADMGAHMLLGQTGMDLSREREQTAAYLIGFAARLRQDPAEEGRSFVTAAQRAEAGTRWLLGIHPQIEVKRDQVALQYAVESLEEPVPRPSSPAHSTAEQESVMVA